VSNLPKKIASSVCFAALYVTLYYVSALVSQPQGFEGVASYFFLPAFVRLLGFLLIGYWIIPALFVATSVLSLTGAYDLGPGVAAELVVTAFISVGGPFGVFVAGRIGGLKPSLDNLTPLRLLGLSIGCAAGNAVFYRIGLDFAGIDKVGFINDLYVFCGDFIGTWTIIYLIKSLMTFYTYSRRA